MPSEKKTIGMAGEEIACHYLKSKGYKIVSRNYSCRFGEIDIIASKTDSLSFIEVKTRSSLTKGNPEESVNNRKLLKIRKTINYFLYENKNIEYLYFSLDIISIILSSPCRDLILYSSAKDSTAFEKFLKDEDYFLNHFINID